MSLEIKTTNSGFKTIDLREMDGGDSIVVTKKYAEARRKEMPSRTPGETWTSVSGCVSYEGEDKVYFNLLNHYQVDGTYETNVEMADRFDALGGEGDKIKITCQEGMVKNKKGEKTVGTTYTFEKVE